jgi:hypothetical protein
MRVLDKKQSAFALSGERERARYGRQKCLREIMAALRQRDYQNLAFTPI